MNKVLSQINIFPIKSTQKISLSQAYVKSAGIDLDRRFMIALTDGSMITSRRYPQLLLISTTIESNGLLFNYPNKPPLSLSFEQLALMTTSTAVWNDNCEAYTTSSDADLWVSEIIGQPAQLLYNGVESQRIGGKAQVKVSFADNFPVMIVSEASLNALNDRAQEVHSMDKFRANLVVSGVNAFAEDSWKRIRIGEVELEIKAPCSRCVLVNYDPSTAKKADNNEPLATLMTFRTDKVIPTNVNFGMNAIVVKEGIVRQGDQVEVLEHRTPETYPDQRVALTCVKREIIAKDFVSFSFKAQKDTALAPYLPGQYLPIRIAINGNIVERCYTLSSSPLEQEYTISVKRIEQGTVSNWLHDNLQVGDTIWSEKPSGQFYLEPHKHQNTLLLSAGSGVTPMMSMLRSLISEKNTQGLTFYHYCKTQTDIPFAAELAEIQRNHPEISIHICLTQDNDTSHAYHGRICSEHFANIDIQDNYHAYVCGSSGFNQIAQELLRNQGLPTDRFHQELFNKVLTKPEQEQSLNIQYKQQQFTGNNQASLLDQIEAAELPIKSGCRAGLCGRCKVKVAEGNVLQQDSAALSEEEKQQGVVLACCSIPTSNITIEQ
ncbi:MOSC domain-containing protein [Photobacterium angustum]|uniref:MOSC N-terminal beta barrel domain-containing protein n=1 Tax=Photobacterium angustum TaxID=661 RepID=UPI0005E3B27F|nr:MOSC N-terminal beta barrel domain-containing protein [Photobacterium angustum]KJF95902.1 hypothetical protein UB39_03100 [Photobacterium angustum]KJG02015.1 hypothetical protein UB35_10555 [Photobacterium angustum]KJG06987.1 hypothetical protein UB33_06935 [Photobacterium angustum]KJG32495.1 hypothetical protein UA69_05600 [Photobacterium angustum]PSV69687.1 MOSC domain-containing protein [Photobacterium angustum]